MWECEPAKGKWSVLAKAYSIIRDHQGKDNTPLDKYLDVNCPFIGIVAPEAYFSTLGYTIEKCNNGSWKLYRKDGINTSSMSTIVSVQDVLINSYKHGILKDKALIQDRVGATTDMISTQNNAAAAQPSTSDNTHAGEDNIANSQAIVQSEAANTSAHDDSLGEWILEDTENLPVVFTLGPEMIYRPNGEAPFYNEDFGDNCAGEDFDPYYGDKFNVYDISDPIREFVHEAFFDEFDL